MYRTADHSARVRDLEEEIERLHRRIEQEDEETEAAEAELRLAQQKLHKIHMHRVLAGVGVIAAVLGCCFVIFFVAKAVASMPDHEHVEWQGQPALQNECSSSEEARSNAECREEAEAECKGETRVKQLDSAETFHAAYSTTTLSCNGKSCTPITTNHPARYTYVFTYQCKVGPK